MRYCRNVHVLSMLFLMYKFKTFQRRLGRLYSYFYSTRQFSDDVAQWILWNNFMKHHANVWFSKNPFLIRLRKYSLVCVNFNWACSSVVRCFYSLLVGKSTNHYRKFHNTRIKGNSFIPLTPCAKNTESHLYFLIRNSRVYIRIFVPINTQILV